MAATLTVNYNATQKAVLSFVGGGNTVPWSTFQNGAYTFNHLNISRVLWTGADWQVLNGNSAVVIDTGGAAWGVLDFGERGTSINLVSNTSFSVTGTTGMLVLELVKSS